MQNVVSSAVPAAPKPVENPHAAPAVVHDEGGRLGGAAPIAVHRRVSVGSWGPSSLCCGNQLTRELPSSTRLVILCGASSAMRVTIQPPWLVPRAKALSMSSLSMTYRAMMAVSQ